MQMRRIDDRGMNLVLAAPTGWVGSDEVARFLAGTAAAPQRAAPEPWRADLSRTCLEGADVVLLLDVEQDDVVLVAGSARTCRIPRAARRTGPVDVAALGTAALRQERERARKRHQLPDKLLAYFEDLNRAQSTDEVFRVVADHALRMVGAHRAFVLLADPAGETLRPALDVGAAAAVPRLERFREPGLVSVADVTLGTAPLAALAPLFHDPSTCLLAHVPFGGDAVLVLTERRDERIFEAEDWDLLRAITLQGEMALRRLRLIESVRALSLTDPLTGLANRRHLEVVLRHAWAAAQRGEPLAVMVLDLDAFKEINDGFGHQMGDQVLRLFASSLLQEARGSDVAVRYGGDEFLVVLPGGNAGGARALAGRVRERMAGWVSFSEGVAEYWSGCASPEELIRAADQSLYESKARRAAAGPAAAPSLPSWPAAGGAAKAS